MNILTFDLECENHRSMKRVCNNRGSHPAEIALYTNKIKKKYPEFTFIEE
jgi:hypothetical protein